MNNNKSIALVLLAYILWGLLPIYWKTVQNFNSAFVLGIRVITTFIFTLIIIIYKKPKLNRGEKSVITNYNRGNFLLALIGFYIFIP